MPPSIGRRTWAASPCRSRYRDSDAAAEDPLCTRPGLVCPSRAMLRADLDCGQRQRNLLESTLLRRVLGSGHDSRRPRLLPYRHDDAQHARTPNSALTRPRELGLRRLRAGPPRPGTSISSGRWARRLRSGDMGPLLSLPQRDFLPRISILDFQVPFSINETAILWSCELHFFFREPSSPPQVAVVALPAKSKTGKPCLSSAWYKHLADLPSWSPDFNAPIASVYPVAAGKGAILRTMLPNSRRVRRLSANSSQHEREPGRSYCLSPSSRRRYRPRHGFPGAGRASRPRVWLRPATSRRA